MLGRWLAARAHALISRMRSPRAKPDLDNSAVTADRTPPPELATEVLIRTIQVNTPESQHLETAPVALHGCAAGSMQMN